MANPNPNPAGRFKSNDPRINRKGRPRSFDTLRELAQQIAHEEAKTDGKYIVVGDYVTFDGKPVIVNGHKVTITEMILRGWAFSKNPQERIKFIEVAFGKVPDNIELKKTDTVTFHVVYDDKPE